MTEMNGTWRSDLDGRGGLDVELRHPRLAGEELRECLLELLEVVGLCVRFERRFVLVLFEEPKHVRVVDVRRDPVVDDAVLSPRLLRERLDQAERFVAAIGIDLDAIRNDSPHVED